MKGPGSGPMNEPFSHGKYGNRHERRKAAALARRAATPAQHRAAWLASLGRAVGPGRAVGCWKMSGGYLRVYIKKRPSFIARWLCKVLLEWDWEDTK